ncbi:peptidase family M1 [Necator americanus]|uniref:Peptidase family M1 n=1 Tax=Necator americanus TaxID=51031 RepID=W2SS89_NECAM|nr:peptidase family M1 [Necator americanus]ETN72614.1 peptidase family M1 [Necator americanus]
MTKMEPADARRFVPCFDEPEYKAIWKVTVIHPNGTRAIANAFEISETTEADGKWKVSTFEPTPIMPSYLLAIFVSEFEFDESYTKRGVRFRVWSTPDTKDKRKYGLKAAVTYMETLERYFDIEDVMKKQGLYDKWLGNLVTMKWWDELWIKEGFANYFENMELNENRDMRIIRNEIVAGLDYSMEKDSLAASRPISSIMDMPIELAEIYDILSYDKADDLWKAFDEVVEGVEGPDGRKLNLVDVGGRWSKQMGFPLVTVEHFNSTTLKIKQERYLKNPKAIEPQKYISSNYGYKWDVPLWYQWDDKQLHYKWLKRGAHYNEPLYIQMKPKDVPIVINADRRSYLAQNYDAEGWKKIIKQLRENHEVSCISSSLENA